MGRSPCCDENGLKKGPWTPEEDQKLIDYINQNGLGSWRALPKHAGLNRCGKSCRLRWTNYLRPDIRRGNFSEDEERIIINLHKSIGNKWSKIASKLPGRTDNEIKNYWNTHMRKKLLQMGIDPVTHKPRTEINQLVNLSQWLYAAQLGNLMTTPWENSMNLHADDAQLAKLQLLQNFLQIINANSLSSISFPNIQLSGPLESQNFNPIFEGQNIFYNNETFSSTAPQFSSDSQDLSNSWNCLENAFVEEGHILSSNHLSNSCGIIQAENHLPQLVSASFEGTCTEKHILQGTTNPGECSTKSSSSPGFDAWEKLMDDESSEASWKELLDMASSFPSP